MADPKKKQDDPRKTPSPVEAKIPGRVPLSVQQERKREEAQRPQEETINPRGKHPGNAVYVARDKKSGAEVSFNEFGQKLDSLGNVVAGDRQRAKDAGAKRIQRPEPELHLSDLKPAPSKGPPPKLVSMQGPVPNSDRSPWDKSPLASEYGNGVAPSAPGGYNPYKNRSFPASMPPSMADITGSNNRLNGASSTTDTSVPTPPIGPQSRPQGWRPAWDIKPLEDFVAGRSEWSPVAPKVNIPGFGQLPASAEQFVPPTPAPSIPFQTDGLNVMPPQGNGMMYDPYGGNYSGNPLSAPPTVEPIGPQNYNRSLDVSDYMPGGRFYRP
jgi:hypothetical protein